MLDLSLLSRIANLLTFAEMPVNVSLVFLERTTSCHCTSHQGYSLESTAIWCWTWTSPGRTAQHGGAPQLEKERCWKYIHLLSLTKCPHHWKAKWRKSFFSSEKIWKRNGSHPQRIRSLGCTMLHAHSMQLSCLHFLSTFFLRQRCISQSVALAKLRDLTNA